MKKGFTLVELSIVLVIIGLLIGGILVGQSLIESSRINAQIRQLQQYDIAARLFKERFKCIPGDCDKVGDPSPADQVGRGDGILNDYTGSVPVFRIRGESFDYFVHLSENGFLNEDYSYPGGGASNYFAGEGYPFAEPVLNADGNRAIVANSNDSGQLFYSFYNWDNTGSNPAITQGGGSMSTNHALSLDAKLDDGLPSSGDFVAVQNNWDSSAGAYYPQPLETAGNCVASSAYITSSDDDQDCTILVKVTEL